MPPTTQPPHRSPHTHTLLLARRRTFAALLHVAAVIVTLDRTRIFLSRLLLVLPPPGLAASNSCAEAPAAALEVHPLERQ